MVSEINKLDSILGQTWALLPHNASDVAHGPLAIYDTSSGEKIIIKTK